MRFTQFIFIDVSSHWESGHSFFTANLAFQSTLTAADCLLHTRNTTSSYFIFERIQFFKSSQICNLGSFFKYLHSLVAIRNRGPRQTGGRNIIASDVRNGPRQRWPLVHGARALRRITSCSDYISIQPSHPSTSNGHFN